MRRWTEAYPERLAYELTEFERRGLRFELDETRLAQTGAVLLTGKLAYKDREIELQVGYPDSYPFMRPEVFAPTLALERHQHPGQHNLCLLDRSSRAWRVDDTAAWLVAEQVPHLLELLETGGEELLAGEAPQGEPASVYLQTQPGAVVFIPEEMLSVPEQHRVGVMQLATGGNEPPQMMLRACLAKLSIKTGGAKKQTLATFSEPLSRRFNSKRIDGRWVRLERLPTGTRPRDLLGEIANVEPALGKPRWQPLPGGGDISVVGAVAPEEVRQGEWQDIWMFVVTVRENLKAPETIYIARGERLTAPDLQERLPASASMYEKTVALVGLGSIGAPIAGELLRAQIGELRVLDYDRVETGNIVRWTHGLSAVSHDKSSVIGGSAAMEYPFTRVKAYSHRIGAIDPPTEGGTPVVTEAQLLDELFDGVGLLIDATGELGVQHLLATLADELEIPQIYAWGTEGGWGGAVARVTPGVSGCWHCLQLAFDDGTIELPPAAPNARVQPRGCGAPTFLASGYALTPIVAQATTVAARTLLGDAPAGDVFVCALKDETGELPAPRWQTFQLPVHDQCPCAHRVAVT